MSIFFLELSPNLRDIVAWFHVTLPNSSVTLIVNGVIPGIVVVDTGANYVMIGKKLDAQMDSHDSHVIEGIAYNRAEGKSHISRGVTKKKVATTLKHGQSTEAKVYLHGMFDNATTYVVLLGAQWIHRIGDIINTGENLLNCRPDWNTTGEEEAYVPIYTYHPPVAYDLDQSMFQGFQRVNHQPALLLDRGVVQEF